MVHMHAKQAEQAVARIPRRRRRSSEVAPAVQVHPANTGNVLQLQKTAGNGAVATLVAGQSASNARVEAAKFMKVGVAHLMAERYDAALEAFKAGYAIYPSPAFVLNEAAVYTDTDRHAEAIDAYERYITDPKAKRIADARKALQRVRATYAKKLHAEGAAHTKEGRFEDALGAFEKGQSTGMNPEQFIYNQAEILKAMGLPESAAVRYERYLVLAPKAPDAAVVRERIEKLRVKPITGGGERGGQDWMTRGVRLMRSKQFDAAVHAFEQGFLTFPSNRFLLNKAAALLDGGRYAEAVMAYERYLSDPIAPRADEARAALERAQKRLGRKESLVTDNVASIKWFERGRKEYAAGQYDKALRSFERAYALNPMAILRYNQAAALHKAGRDEAAAKRYEMYLDEKPDAPDAAKVRKMIAKLRAQASSAAQEAFDRGEEAYKAGKWDEAAEAFAEAYDKLKAPDLLFNYAAALDKGGKKTEAIRIYARYLILKPGAADAGRVRARITKLQIETGTELMVPGA